VTFLGGEPEWSRKGLAVQGGPSNGGPYPVALGPQRRDVLRLSLLASDPFIDALDHLDRLRSRPPEQLGKRPSYAHCDKQDESAPTA